MTTSLTSSRVVTYSPALTLVPTYECFNRCEYCNFRVDPLVDRWMSLQEAEERLQVAQSQSVIEILILSGEVHPQSPRRAAWLHRIYDIGELALKMGFLPHTNVGPLSQSEMAFLQRVNVSMGLMLEQVTPTLLQGVHRHAPSKSPELRLQQLEQAGQLKIPFTTGLLLGIGESQRDRIATLKAIATCHQRWGHIQEVILQPHQPGTYQLQTLPAFTANDLANFVSTARQYLPADITLQIPPNLVTNQSDLLAAIANGAQDLGGIGPIDEVNPDYHHPKLLGLKHQLQNAGLIMRPRLPIYPRYDHWLAPAPRQVVAQWRLSLQDVASIPQLPLSRPEVANLGSGH